MLCPPLSPSPLVVGWLERHRNPASFVLHILGIPPTIVALLLVPVYAYLASPKLFLLAVALFVGGYGAQFLGHAIEGTDPGEVILLKRKLGWPYVDVAPARGKRLDLKS